MVDVVSSSSCLLNLETGVVLDPGLPDFLGDDRNVMLLAGSDGVAGASFPGLGGVDVEEGDGRWIEAE